VKIDLISKLQNLLQIVAFCLVVATIQYLFMPERPYGPPVAYSMAIGVFTWAIIDLGRHLFPSAAETGWPSGLTGLLLVFGGIAGGYLLGNALADAACRTLDLYAGSPPLDRAVELRNSILITAMAGSAASYYFYAVNKSAYLERKMVEAHHHASEARLKLLETQLEPHMLFNTLANLRALIGVDPERAQVMLDHMISYLRATLSGSRATTHPLAAEFARLEDYLALMAVRMGPRLRLTLDLPASLQKVPVPPLLLQPLVENAIRHGLEPQVDGGHITVRAQSAPEGLLLEVTDTGIGFDPGAPRAASADSSFGLAQVRERVATAYDGHGRVEVSSTPGSGTVIRIHLPLAPPNT
jgi:hypothetical protein